MLLAKRGGQQKASFLSNFAPSGHHSVANLLRVAWMLQRICVNRGQLKVGPMLREIRAGFRATQGQFCSPFVLNSGQETKRIEQLMGGRSISEIRFSAFFRTTLFIRLAAQTDGRTFFRRKALLISSKNLLGRAGTWIALSVGPRSDSGRFFPPQSNRSRSIMRNACALRMISQ